MQKKEQGQVMLMTTLILSSTLLAATTLAGLLMIYQVRQSGNATRSAEALYAADAGIEAELYRFYQNACSESIPTLDNGAQIDTQVTRQPNDDGGQDIVIKSTGSSNRNARAFSLNLGALQQLTCDEQAAASP